MEAEQAPPRRQRQWGSLALGGTESSVQPQMELLQVDSQSQAADAGAAQVVVASLAVVAILAAEAVALDCSCGSPSPNV